MAKSALAQLQEQIEAVRKRGLRGGLRGGHAGNPGERWGAGRRCAGTPAVVRGADAGPRRGTRAARARELPSRLPRQLRNRRRPQSLRQRQGGAGGEENAAAPPRAPRGRRSARPDSAPGAAAAGPRRGAPSARMVAEIYAGDGPARRRPGGDPPCSAESTRAHRSPLRRSATRSAANSKHAGEIEADRQRPKTYRIKG